MNTGAAQFVELHQNFHKIDILLRQNTEGFLSEGHQIFMDHHSTLPALTDRPPNSLVTEFLDDFLSLVKFLGARPSPTVLRGDFNIYTCTQTYTPVLLNNLHLLDSVGLQQHIDFPTHLHGHIHDLLILQHGIDMTHNFNSRDQFSDHCCITANPNTVSHKPTQIKTRVKFINFKKLNLDALRQDLVSCDLLVNSM